MNAEKRRDNILKLLAESDSPLSGTDLAKCLAVSRQVIVQDIALCVQSIKIFYLPIKDICYFMKKRK